MSETGPISGGFPEGWNDERLCYLTTTGRVTGRPHEVEIWFVLYDNRVYIVSGRGERSDWVRNLRKDPAATIRVGDEGREARGVVLEDSADHPSRQAWAEKYGRNRPTSLLVEFSAA